MDRIVTLFGYGEAAQSFVRAATWKESAHVFDIKIDSALTRSAILASYEADGVVGAYNPKDALAESLIILSLVTASEALRAAENVAQNIASNALYFDMNSVAPETKRLAAKLIESAGGRYVDAAIMAPVNPLRLMVPLLVSGQHTVDGAAALISLGFTNVRVAVGDVGRASSIKMIRSVMIKGVEALTAEMILAAEAAGVTDEVLSSLGDDWASKAVYNLERMKTHGVRRAAEMQEAAKTLTALGVEPIMTESTIRRQQEMAE